MSEVACPPAAACSHVLCCVCVCRGAREVFTSLRHFRDDLVRHPPDHFVCVPLVLDTLYNKVGGCGRGDWAGGGSLPLGTGGRDWVEKGETNLCAVPVEEDLSWLFLRFPHVDCSSLSEGPGC